MTSTYIKFRTRTHLSDAFLSELPQTRRYHILFLSQFTLAHASKGTPKKNQDKLQLYGIHQPLVYADVSLL
jgi:hypothetical protein